MLRAMLVLFLFAVAVVFAALLVLLCFEQSAPADTDIAVSSTAGVIPQTNWRLKYADSQELAEGAYGAANAFDGNTTTIWHTLHAPTPAPPPPHEIQIDLGASYTIGGFRYLPRQWGGANGGIARYEFYVSTDGTNWGSAVATGTFAKDATEKEVLFIPKTGQYIRLRALTEINGNPWTSVAEINVLNAAINVTGYHGTITATWLDTSTGEDGFFIESGPSVTGPFAVVGQVGQHIMLFTEPDHYAGPQACYRVQAFLGVQKSPYSSVTCLTVPQMPDEQVTASCGMTTAVAEPIMRISKKKLIAKKNCSCPPTINP